MKDYIEVPPMIETFELDLMSCRVTSLTPDYLIEDIDY